MPPKSKEQKLFEGRANAARQAKKEARNEAEFEFQPIVSAPPLQASSSAVMDLNEESDCSHDPHAG